MFMIAVIILMLGAGILLCCTPFIIVVTNIWAVDGILLAMLIKGKYGDRLPVIIEGNEMLNGLLLMGIFLTVLGFLSKKVKIMAVILGVVFTGLYTYQMYLDFGLAWPTYLTFIMSAVFHVRSFYGEFLWSDVADSFMGWLRD